MAQIYKCDKCGREINEVMDVLHLTILDCVNDPPHGLNFRYDICSRCTKGFANWLKYGGEFDEYEEKED